MIKRIVVACVAVVALVFGFAAPAQASLAQCANGQVCIWTNTSYGGSFAEYQSSTIYQAPGHCWKFAAGTFNNSVSSYASKWVIDGFNITYYDNNSCTGTKFVEANTPYAFANMPGGWDNRLGSISVTMK